MNIFYFLLLTVSCLGLSYSGNWTVKSLIEIARFLEWRSFIVSSVLMGFATALPEIFIGITSAFHNEPEIVLGVVIGENIIVLTIIISVVALLTNEVKLKTNIQKSIFYAILCSLLPFILLRDGRISRTDGLILIIAFLFYFSELISQQKDFGKVFNGKENNWHNFKLFLPNILIFIVSIIGLLLSAQGIIFSTLKIAKIFNVPTTMITIFMVAIGTSLPEITFGIKSVELKKKDMIIGKIIGSTVTRSTLALGVTALFSPIVITNFESYFNGITFILITYFFFLVFARTDHKITKTEASLLIIIYLSFVLTEIGYLDIGNIPFFPIQ